jgi:hypothetical protein
MVQMKTGRQFSCRKVDNAGRLYLHGNAVAFIGDVGQPLRMSAEHVSETITSTAGHVEDSPTVSERLLSASNTHLPAASDERPTRQSRRCLLPAASVGRMLRLLNLLLLGTLLGPPCLASGADGGQRYLYDGQSVQLIPGDIMYISSLQTHTKLVKVFLQIS